MRRLAAVARRTRPLRPRGSGTSDANGSSTVGRCAAGMLGVLVAETWLIGASDDLGARGPNATAMVDLARTLTQATARDGLGEVAGRHPGVVGPAWLLPLALAQTEPIELSSELAARADVPTEEVRSCVAYVELAALIVAEQPVAAVIGRVTGRAVPAEQPLETGHSASDGLTLGLWALTQPATFGELLGKLAATSSPPVVAAAAGVVGLRDGLDAIPAEWYRQLELTDDCLALARPLLQTASPHPRADIAG